MNVLCIFVCVYGYTVCVYGYIHSGCDMGIYTVGVIWVHSTVCMRVHSTVCDGRERGREKEREREREGEGGERKRERQRNKRYSIFRSTATHSVIWPASVPRSAAMSEI